MKQNMGSVDRIVRLVIAVIIAALYFSGKLTGTLGIVLLVLAAIFAVTGFISFCPLYLPFGLSTKKK
ncbi:MAG: DUF2892 domain-containing protein [Flavobacteriales bacterium]|nr:DUF2892 domain-containing protein [Flavobacteriales bacterium]MBL0043801.1 DUF2892 domain-containing protein [Flavobacteriales bacterium]